MATAYQVNQAIENYGQLEYDNQQLLIKLAIVSITKENEAPAISELVAGLEGLERRLAQDLAVQEGLERRKKHAHEVDLVRYILENASSEDLAEDPAWPSIMELMKDCSGFIWTRSPFADHEKFFWPQDIHEEEPQVVEELEAGESDEQSSRAIEVSQPESKKRKQDKREQKKRKRDRKDSKERSTKKSKQGEEEESDGPVPAALVPALLEFDRLYKVTAAQLQRIKDYRVLNDSQVAQIKAQSEELEATKAANALLREEVESFSRERDQLRGGLEEAVSQVQGENQQLRVELEACQEQVRQLQEELAKANAQDLDTKAAAETALRSLLLVLEKRDK